MLGILAKPFLKYCMPSILFAITLFVFAAAYDNYFGRRRLAYRFGGEEAFSFGTQRAWLKYLLYAIAWETIKSFFTLDTAAELGATLFQTPLIVLTWFVCDRLHMAYEYRPDLPKLPKRLEHKAYEALENPEHAHNDVDDVAGSDIDLSRIVIEPDAQIAESVVHEPEQGETASVNTKESWKDRFFRRFFGGANHPGSSTTKKLASEFRGRR